MPVIGDLRLVSSATNSGRNGANQTQPPIDLGPADVRRTATDVTCAERVIQWNRMRVGSHWVPSSRRSDGKHQLDAWAPAMQYGRCMPAWGYRTARSSMGAEWKPFIWSTMRLKDDLTLRTMQVMSALRARERENKERTKREQTERQRKEATTTQQAIKAATTWTRACTYACARPLPLSPDTQLGYTCHPPSCYAPQRGL